MRPRGTPTRLEVHRLKFHQNGRRGTLLTISELSSEEKDILTKEVMKDIRVQKLTFVNRSDAEIWDGAYLEVLQDWGVICHHPRRSVTSLKKTPGHRCELCGCLVFPTAAIRAAVAIE
jgi:hypothetical protein